MPSMIRGPASANAPPSTMNTRSSRTARIAAQPSGRGDAAHAARPSEIGPTAGQQDEHLRVHLDDRGPAGRSCRLAGLAQHLPAAREPDLVGHPAAGRPGRVHLVEDDDPRRRKPVVLAPDDDLGQDLEPLAEVLDDGEGLVLGLGHRPDRDDRVEHALHGAGREGQDRRGPVALEGALEVARVERAVLAVADEHELGIRGRDRAQVGTGDAREVEQLVIETERDHDLRRRGQERDDPHATSLRMGRAGPARGEGQAGLMTWISSRAAPRSVNHWASIWV